MFSIEKMLENDRKAVDIVGLSMNRKEMEYYTYIVQHRFNIKYMYIKYRDILESTLNLSDTKLDMLESRLDIHDSSKFTDKEFYQYRLAFYPIEEEKATMGLDDPANREKVMHSAWVHHYTYNDHHPEYWQVDDGYARKMPKTAVAEMILDWLAMQFTSGKSVFEWYEKNEPNIIFHPETREQVRHVMNAIKEYNHQIGEDNL